MPEAMLSAALETGYEALAQTTEMNPVLKKAGVVDAGGKGYLLILEGMLAAVRGEPIPETTEEKREKADFAALTDEEIKNADVVIVAASKRVPLARFDGKLMIQTAVNTGIRKPEQLFNRIKNGQAQPFHATEDDTTLGEKLFNKIKSIFS